MIPIIPILTVLGYVSTALQAAKVLTDLGGDAIDLYKQAKPIYDKATNLISKAQAGEQITQAELDDIEADGDRLTAIAEKHEAETPSA